MGPARRMVPTSRAIRAAELRLGYGAKLPEPGSRNRFHGRKRLGLRGRPPEALLRLAQLTTTFLRPRVTPT